MVNSSLTNIKKCNAIFIYANRRKVMNCEYTPKQTVIPHNFLWTMTKQRNLENSKHLATGMFNHYSGFNCYAIGKMCACLICSCTTASMTFYKLLHHTLTNSIQICSLKNSYAHNQPYCLRQWLTHFPFSKPKNRSPCPLCCF